jgi:hypothetical protein
MQSNLLRSAGAVVAACLIAFAAVSLAPLVWLPVAEQISPAYLVNHTQVIFAIAYMSGAVLVGLLAGAAVGLLAPGRPAVHMLSAVAVMELVGLAVGGTRTLPHGWQILSLILQIVVASAVAALTWNRAHRRTSIVPQAI